MSKSTTSKTDPSVFDNIQSYDWFKSSAIGNYDPAELGTGAVCLKKTIVIINCFFILLGIIMIILGSAASSNQYAKITGDTVPTGILAIGVFILFMAFVGCVAAGRQSRVILVFYCVILSILIICQIAIGAAIYVKRSELPELLLKGWDSSSNDLKVVLQNNLVCCGFNVFNLTSIGGSTSGIAGVPCPEQTYITQKACSIPMTDAITGSYFTVAIVSIITAFIEIVGLFFSLYIIRSVNKAQENL